MILCVCLKWHHIETQETNLHQTSEQHQEAGEVATNTAAVKVVTAVATDAVSSAVEEGATDAADCTVVE